MALDAESRLGPLLLSGEYTRRDRLPGILLDGCQVTAGFNSGRISSLPMIIFFRYD
jgi:hypothetical protein